MTFRRILLVIGVLLVLAVIVFVFQNIETVQVRFLFWVFEAQRAVIFVGFFALGLLGGLAYPLYRRSRRWIATRRHPADVD